MMLSNQSDNQAKQTAYACTSSLACAVMTAVVLCTLVVGCTGQYNADEMDRDAYRIVDSKWGKNMGSKANYRISDSAPLAGDLKPERLPGNLGILTLPQAVALATAQNREYQSQREVLYQKALDLRLTGHQFDRQYFGALGGGFAGQQNDAIFGTDASVGFNQLMADGTQIGMKVGLAWVDVLFGNWKEGLTALLDVSLNKPLLRGSKRDIVLEPLKQADRDVLYQVRAFNRYRKTFVVSVISDYYRTLLLKDIWQNTVTHRQALVALRDQAQILLNAGRLPKLEIERLDQELLKTDDLLLESQRAYKQALDEFKIALGINPSIQFQLDARELAILKKAKLDFPTFAEAEAVSTALASRLDLANEIDRLEDAQRKVAVARDQLQGDLNIAGRNSMSSNRRGNRQSLILDNTFRRFQKDNEYQIGLECGLPLDRVGEQNLLRQAEIAVTQQQRTYDALADHISLQLRQAYRDLYKASQQYQVQSEGMDLAQKRLENTTLMLRHNRASTRRVLQALDDLYEAKNAATTAVVDYSITTLKFYRDTGVLQVRPDGMWEL